MALVTKAIKGTQDIMPDEVYKNQFIEQTVLDIARKFGFREIRTPVFEHTELFQRGVGETTDVVQKEMYALESKGTGEARYALRPEGTACIVRSIIENGKKNQLFPTIFHPRSRNPHQSRLTWSSPISNLYFHNC